MDSNSFVLGTIKAGARCCRIAEGVVVAHPDDPPYLLRWDRSKVELKVTADGVILLPDTYSAGLDCVTLTFVESPSQ